MGDIWPYGPPKFVTWDTAYRYLIQWGMSATDADIGAAIGEAESSLDLSVINDTPSTGDYSVGVWQINYLGQLYAERTKEFGTPKQLIEGGISAQAHACYILHRQSGFTPWSTYNNGKYKQYLHGKVPPGPRPGPQPGGIPAPTSPGKDSWAGQVRVTAGHFQGAAKTLTNAGHAIDLLRR